MKFSLDWIGQFVQTGMDARGLAARLTAAGLPVETLEPADDDTILDIDIFANRPDCMNIYGVAREAAAATGRPLAPYPSAAPEDPKAEAASGLASVSIEDPAICGRYLARIVSGVRIGPSPDWLARRLVTVGVRPVNNVVDATNFVLWEFGHPLHAFDLSRLAGPRIVVRGARAGESLVTLDGVARSLKPGMPVIADAATAVALGGIMGGEGTMVTGATTSLLIESAWFAPAAVRRAARALALSTDASYRFERGADIEGARIALDRVSALIVELAGGRIHPGVLEARPAPAAPRRIALRGARLNTLLGIEVAPERARAALTALGFAVTARGADLDAIVPSHRVDVEREVDLIEEVARQIGYDAIPERLPHIAGTGAVRRAGARREAALRRALSAGGFAEALTTSFASRARDAAARGLPPVAVANPIAADQEILRTTLLPGLVAALAHNVNHGEKTARLFEIGRVFHPGESGLPSERLMLAAGMTGEARERHWLEPGREAGFHDLAGLLTGALREAGVETAIASPLPCPAIDPACGATIAAGGVALGPIGALSAAAQESAGLKQPAFVTEIDLTALFDLPERAVAFRPLPRYPAVSRDLSIVVGREQRYGDLEGAIHAAAAPRVARVAIVDRYEGGSLPAGSVGLSINVVFQHPDRTLESGEVAELMGRIVENLSGRFGARLRA